MLYLIVFSNSLLKLTETDSMVVTIHNLSILYTDIVDLQNKYLFCIASVKSKVFISLSPTVLKPLMVTLSCFKIRFQVILMVA